MVSGMSGPALPQHRRGTTFTGLVSSADWYATFVEGVAGGGPLPGSTGPIAPDSINLWDAIKTPGRQDSPRKEVVHQVSNQHFTEGVTAIRGEGGMKLILGNPGDDRVLRWPKPPSPDAPKVPFGKTGGLREGTTGHCRAPPTHGKVKPVNCLNGCLFNITEDEAETTNLINDPKHSAVVAHLTQRLKEVGEAAPPKSQYYPEPQPFHSVLEQICASSIKTNFLEPVSVH